MSMTQNASRIFLTVVLAALLAPAAVSAQYGAENGEWRHYGGDLGGTKYSPLDQVDGSNFEELRISWRWESADLSLDIEALREQTPEISVRSLQGTPLMVEGVLYLPTALHQVAAIDAGTGETLWVHDPEAYLDGVPPHAFRNRGVAYWSDGGSSRILWGTGNAYLVAVDARTGQPVADFGNGGRVDLMEGIPRATRGALDHRGRTLLSVSSPPLVARDVVVTPTIISDYAVRRDAPPGWIKGIDARNGETRWVFHTVPQAGEPGVETWLYESWAYSGNTNVWSFFSADEELGILYAPIGTPTSDYYGGHRLGDNLFAESLVALDIETGERLWHFQAVHHGVWDYDFPAAPNLVDITVDGRRIRAVAQVSKQAFTYVFDRVTGEPVWPIEERPVATDTDLPGEVLSPTQPFPTKPPPFDYQGVTLDDLVDFTPEIRAVAVEAVEDFRLGPLFTPPMLTVEGGLQGTLQRPQLTGGANWGGAGVDPERGTLYVPSDNGFAVMKYISPDTIAGANLRLTQGPFGGGTLPEMPDGLPLLKPPYSRITAIDLNRGEHAWMQPTGNGDRIRNHPLLQDLDLPPLGGDSYRGGPVVTRTLLVGALTAGGTADGPRLVARDKFTGEILGSVDLPGIPLGTPMTYMHEGRQYIALTVFSTVPELVAFSLEGA